MRMSRPKGMPIFISYTHASEPDTQLFAELTKKAIGPDRSLTNFASACELSPSTVSRIVNQQFKTPSSDKVIQAIAANADPKSGVTAEILLKAQGRVPVQISEVTLDPNSILAKSVTTPLTKRRKAKGTGLHSEIAQEIIQTALLKKGYRISVVDKKNVVSIPGLQYRADFVVEINRGPANLGFNRWAFDVHMDGVRPIMQKLSWIFGTAYLESFRDKKTKMSLIVNNKTEFDEVKKLLKQVRIHDLVSIILIDANKRQIVEEFLVPTKDDLRAPVIIMD